MLLLLGGLDTTLTPTLLLHPEPHQGWEIQNTPYNNTWIPGVLPNPGLYSSLYYSSSLCPAPRATGLVHAYQPECVPTSAVDRNCT